MSQLVREVVAAVVAVREAKTRIYIGGATFFSKNDIWKYIEISDNKLCPDCKGYAQAGIGDEIGEYRGNRIRGLWPYLEIRDINTIAVNEHPNCRCILVRLHTIEPEGRHES